MSAQSNNWIRWAVGISIMLAISGTGYTMGQATAIAADRQLLKNIHEDVLEIKEKMATYEQNMTTFYQRKPVYQVELDRAISRHRHD
tara:strand:+ start:17253 stop:17513 length:261 start_codon:yes stop_codon:yes gene_type:complete